MQQQSELEHTLYTSGRGAAIYKHQKEEDFLSGELRRGLLTDIYLQNVIREVRTWKKWSGGNQISDSLFFPTVFLIQFLFSNVLRMCVLKRILKFLCSLLQQPPRDLCLESCCCGFWSITSSAESSFNYGSE